MRSKSEGVVNRLLVTSFLLVSTAVIPSLYARDSSGSSTAMSGRAVFESKGCAKCHSIRGKGGDEGPDLGEDKFYGTRLELAASMWNHVPEMLERMDERHYAFPRLSDAEMGELITYLSYQRYAGGEGNERTGRKLLKKKKCIMCHNFGGEGGDIGPDICSSAEYLSPLKMATSMWNHGPDMMEYFEEQDIKRPTFKGDEVTDLAAGIRSYMRTTKVPPGSYDLGDVNHGRMLLTEKGCLRCHEVMGDGGDVGPAFDDLDFSSSVSEIAGRMWNHGPKMWESMEQENVPFPTLTASEMADLLACLFALELEDAPGDPQRGASLFNEMCADCHAGAGEVGHTLQSTAQLQSPLQMVAIMWNHAPEVRSQQIELKSDWPKLNDRQVAHLFAYLKSAESRGAQDY